MSRADPLDVSYRWAGLAVMERLSETGAGLASEEVGGLLGTRSVKGVGAALSGTRSSLAEAGIRFDEAVVRRTVRGRSVWTVGPRIRQARHALEFERLRWTGKQLLDNVRVDDAPPGHRGPVLVLRALKCNGTVCRIHGPMAELGEILADEWFESEAEGEGSIGEVFIHRIEPGEDGREHWVPEGYGENGIWVRGQYDYAEPRVAGAIGSGRYPVIDAWIGEAGWVERRLVLGDAVRQVEKIRVEGWPLGRDAVSRWTEVEEDTRFRYVRWIGAHGVAGPTGAPPLRMRLRCWYEVVIETTGRQRAVLRAEGLRGDAERTARRAIARWRNAKPERAEETVALLEVRIAKSQPRPMPPEEEDR